ncbi:MAG: beta-N-acetylhexosaminidase [Candidatus Glassbacteria bacterium]
MPQPAAALIDNQGRRFQFERAGRFFSAADLLFPCGMGVQMSRMSPLLAFSLLASVLCTDPVRAEQFRVIPRPVRIEAGQGSFILSDRTVIMSRAADSSVAEYLRRCLGRKTGVEPALAVMSGPEKPEPGTIVLMTSPPGERPGREAYELRVTPDRVTAKASGPEGLFYACQTLLQLLEPGRQKTGDSAWSLPAVTVEDAPRFPWRGLMIDCSRTFQSLEYLERYIDLLARYKLNVLHLHLTDDQGWRVEIRKYPELTRVGAKFAPQYDKAGGYYTRQQIRELVRYGSDRQVKIVPEIEMPGHCLAALASYPWLSCTGERFEIYPFFKGPGIQENVFCAGNEATFEFLEGVLEEVADMFPCEFVHIGGDEVPKVRWKNCPKCRERMKAEGLRDENELQSWFVRRIEKILEARGKRLIGWDEILEGGLAPRATVMSWRGMKGGIQAVQQGHDVVMSPTSHCYLDYTHEETSVEKAYSFEPVPDGFDREQAGHVLGLQGNIWTHIAVTEPDTDRQVFPRLIALAEVAWSPAAARDWESFCARLQPQLAELKALGVNYYENWR